MIMELRRVAGMDNDTGEIISAFQVITDEGGIALIRSDRHIAVYNYLISNLYNIEKLLGETNTEEDFIEDAIVVQTEE